MQLDVLAFEAHPDDTELSCGGTLAKLSRRGYKVGVVSLTAAELGTRGTPEERRKEFEASAEVLGLSAWEILDIPDGNIASTQGNREKVIRTVRRYRPQLVLAPYWVDRHPDHANASTLVREACFYAGLERIDTGQPPHRPGTIVYYPLHHEFSPSLVVDITDTFETKLAAIRCFRSQFHTGDERFRGQSETYISSAEFLQLIETRARYWGSKIGAAYGEAFLWPGPVPVDDLVSTFAGIRDLR